MPAVARFQHRDDLLPGAVASAVAYESHGIPHGEHRGIPSPWLTFIVSIDGPVRVSGTVAEGDRFDPERATSYDVMLAGLDPVAARVEQPTDQAGVQLSVHPLAAQALLGCRASELKGQGTTVSTCSVELRATCTTGSAARRPTRTGSTSCRHGCGHE